MAHIGLEYILVKVVRIMSTSTLRSSGDSPTTINRSKKNHRQFVKIALLCWIGNFQITHTKSHKLTYLVCANIGAVVCLLVASEEISVLIGNSDCGARGWILLLIPSA